MLDAHPAPLRLGSVCTGYGGLDLAVRRTFGGELAWVADNDPGAARILAHHHPRVPNLGDITTTDWHTVPPVDVVMGGYPCQPFSTAGKRKGTADARHIWPHIARALGVLRPRYAIFENVAGHLCLGFDTVLTDLAALGFDARWCTLRASDVGAAHQRKRLFVLAWPADTPGPGRQGEGLPGRAAHRGLTAAHPLHLGGDRHRPHRPGRHEPQARRLTPADPHVGGQRTALDDLRPGKPDPARCPVADATGQRRGEGRPEPAGQQGRPDAALGSAPDWGTYGPAVHRWENVL